LSVASPVKTVSGQLFFVLLPGLPGLFASVMAAAAESLQVRVNNQALHIVSLQKNKIALELEINKLSGLINR
jgi:hypothetical protein